MKCVGMQYLEAIQNLKAAGFKPQRSIHVSFVPDEEIGGHDGAEKFYGSNKFKELNVAAVMDEGLASPEDKYKVFYGERTVWSLVVKASGSPAHGSRLFDGMALQNLRETLNKIDEFRTTQFEKVKSGKAAEGEVVSINNVFLKAGSTHNGWKSWCCDLPMMSRAKLPRSAGENFTAAAFSLAKSSTSSSWSQLTQAMSESIQVTTCFRTDLVTTC